MRESADVAETPLVLARRAAAYLEDKGIEGARLDAELLLAHVLGLSRLELYLQHDRPLTPAEVEAYREVVRRRARREPLQYIVGSVRFRELELKVDPRVLIPRPETEVLVEEVLKWARERAGEWANRDGEDRGGGQAGLAQRGELSAVDIGTGSGAIALSLAYEGSFTRVVATDVSADAIAVAEENARRHGLLDRVEFRRESLWKALAPGERFDVVVSNPPYVSEAERPGLQPEVRDWEPATALFAPEGGLGILMALVDGAPNHLRPGGLLALEVGFGQAEAVVRRIEATGRYGAPRVVRDLAGRERVVLATLAALANGTEESNHA